MASTSLPSSQPTGGQAGATSASTTPKTPPALARPKTSPSQSGSLSSVRRGTASSASTEGSQDQPVLAEARAETACTLKIGQDKDGKPIREDVTLRLHVQVQPCPIPFLTRLGYHGTLTLRRRGRPEQEVGCIIAWRVSKPSRSQPRIDSQYFIQEWLKTPLDSQLEQPPLWTELAYAMRALYTNNGRPRKAVDKAERAVLADDGSDLVFIQMLHVLWKDENGLDFQGNGFGPRALDMFYRILTSSLLPAWYNVPTPATFLLSPGIPSGDEGARWESMRPAGVAVDSDQFIYHVEDSLKAMYGRWGYVIFVDQFLVRSSVPGENAAITVMGRTFDSPVPSAPGDRLLPVGRQSSALTSSPLLSSASSSPIRRRQVTSSSSGGRDSN